MSWSRGRGSGWAEAAKPQQTCLLSSPFFLPLFLLMQADSHSEHAPTPPPPSSNPPPPLTPLPPSPPLTNHHRHLGILAMHSLQAAAGPQRRTWYTLCRGTKNPMQFKSERSSGVKIVLADTLSFVSRRDNGSFWAGKAHREWKVSLQPLCFNLGQWGSKEARAS